MCVCGMGVPFQYEWLIVFSQVKHDVGKAFWYKVDSINLNHKSVPTIKHWPSSHYYDKEVLKTNNCKQIFHITTFNTKYTNSDNVSIIANGRNYKLK